MGPWQKMNLTKKFKEAIFFVPQSIKAFRFLIHSLPEFISKGGIEIESTIPYEPKEAQGHGKYSFRTVIQLDGDIVNLLPRLDTYFDDQEWCKSYEETLNHHQSRVNRKLAELGGVYTIPWILSGTLSIILTLFSGMKDFSHEWSIPLYTRLLSFTVLTYLFRKFVAGYILRKTLEILFTGGLKKNFKKHYSKLISDLTHYIE
jgi:hypothetical protein